MAAKKRKEAGSDGAICKNRRAAQKYSLGERMEAGVVLQGTEVKACREGKAHLNDAYVQVNKGEAFLVNAHIAEYAYGNRQNHEPTRTRKLLLHAKEIHKLAVRIHERGATVIPLAMYFNEKGRVKVEIALAAGKTHSDQRETIKQRDVNRELRRTMRRRR